MIDYRDSARIGADLVSAALGERGDVLFLRLHRGNVFSVAVATAALVTPQMQADTEAAYRAVGESLGDGEILSLIYRHFDALRAWLGDD